ncbi:MAG: hypothetical protein JRE23_18425 [Deltaproteobacteria bacterium]|nr:hypothetical protein [Deltaproteobacteria bacterium]
MDGKIKDGDGGAFTGDGHTGDQALNELAKNITGQTILVRSWKNGDLELEVPELDLINVCVTR